MRALAAHTGLGPSSALVDIGAGIGRPLLHATQAPGVAAAWGVEIDPVKCSKGRALVDLVTRDLAAAGLLAAPASTASAAAARPALVCAPVEALATLAPATHAYAAWEGMPRSAKAAFGALFAAAPGLGAVAVVQRAFRRAPAAEMAELGFGPLELLATFPVHLAGSQCQLNAYIFAKPGRRGSSGGGGSGGGALAAEPAVAAAAAEVAAGRKKAAPAAAGAAAAGGQRRGGGKRKPAAAAAATAAAAEAAADDAASELSSDSALPLAQWLRLNGIAPEAAGCGGGEATSGRVRRRRRLS